VLGGRKVDKRGWGREDQGERWEVGGGRWEEKEGGGRREKEKGEGRREKGEGRREKGEGRRRREREKGEGRREKGQEEWGKRNRFVDEWVTRTHLAPHPLVTCCTRTGKCLLPLILSTTTTTKRTTIPISGYSVSLLCASVAPGDFGRAQLYVTPQTTLPIGQRGKRGVSLAQRTTLSVRAGPHSGKRP
jgi:hypothetical protein